MTTQHAELVQQGDVMLRALDATADVTVSGDVTAGGGNMDHFALRIEPFRLAPEAKEAESAAEELHDRAPEMLTPQVVQRDVDRGLRRRVARRRFLCASRA